MAEDCGTATCAARTVPAASICLIVFWFTIHFGDGSRCIHLSHSFLVYYYWVAEDCGTATCAAKQRVHGEAQAEDDPAGRTPAAGRAAMEGRLAG